MFAFPARPPLHSVIVTAILIFASAGRAQSFPASELDELALYQYGQSNDPRAGLTKVLREADAPTRQLIAARLLACLASDVSEAARDYAQRQLAQYGTVENLPQLLAMIENETATEAALYVITALPGPEADDALVQALQRMPSNRAAIVLAAMANRRSASAAPVVAPYLDAPNPEVQTAAVHALINIDGEVAWTALADAYPRLSAELQARIDRAAVPAARTAPGGGAHFDAATALQARVVALRALDAAALLPLVEAALTGDNREEIAALTLALNDVSCPACFDALIEAAPQLPVGAHAHLMGAMRKSGYAPEPAVLLSALTSGSETERMTALLLIDGWGDEQFILPLANFIVGKQDDRENLELWLARTALTGLVGEKVNETLLSLLDKVEAPVQAQLLSALSVRNVAEAVPQFLEFAGADDALLWREAFKGLSRLAGVDYLDSMFDMLRAENNPQKRSQEVFALRAVLNRIEDDAARLNRVKAALSAAEQPEARQALYQLIGDAGGELSVPVLEEAFMAETGDTQTAVVRVLATLPPEHVVKPLFRLAGENRGTRAGQYALEGALQVLGRLSETVDATTLLDYLAQAQDLCGEPWEYKRLLGTLGRMGRIETLPLAARYLGQPEVSVEAVRAVHDIVFAKASISTNDDAQAQAGNMIDGDSASVWSVAVPAGQQAWIELDMGQEVLFRSAVLDSTLTASYASPQIRVYIAREPGQWGAEIANVQGSTLSEIALGDRPGRYMRFEVPESSEQALLVLNEIRFLGNDGITLGVLPPAGTPKQE